MTPGTSAPHDYGFDASGNLTAMPTGATGTYNSAGELTASTLSGTTTSYTYNADGEQLTSAQGSTTQSSATWNGAGQLSTYTNNAANMSVASYDGNNLRTSTTITQNGGPTVTQGYVWDTVPQVPQLLMDGNSAYVYDGEAPPAEQVNLSTGAITYLIADSLGSIRGTVNSSGALTGTTSYDAWGSPLTPGGLSSFTPFGYAGGYADPDGLIYLVNRYYEPSTGQFISVDPAITVTAQPYSYANDDPVSLTDPAGDVAGIAVKYHLCCWIDVYYNWQRTVQVADEDAGIRTAAITLVCGVASRYLPDPFDRFICDAVKKFIESSHAEAAKIVKNAGGKNAYITANNKYCLAGYIGIQYHWGIPYVASHWWSYKRTSFAGKRTCLKTY
jgi:RHS repeat-associated protein